MKAAYPPRRSRRLAKMKPEIDLIDWCTPPPHKKNKSKHQKGAKGVKPPEKSDTRSKQASNLTDLVEGEAEADNPPASLHIVPAADVSTRSQPKSSPSKPKAVKGNVAPEAPNKIQSGDPPVPSNSASIFKTQSIPQSKTCPPTKSTAKGSETPEAPTKSHPKYQPVSSHTTLAANAPPRSDPKTCSPVESKTARAKESPETPKAPAKTQSHDPPVTSHTKSAVKATLRPQPKTCSPGESKAELKQAPEAHTKTDQNDSNVTSTTETDRTSSSSPQQKKKPSWHEASTKARNKSVPPFASSNQTKQQQTVEQARVIKKVLRASPSGKGTHYAALDLPQNNETSVIEKGHCVHSLKLNPGKTEDPLSSETLRGISSEDEVRVSPTKKYHYYDAKLPPGTPRPAAVPTYCQENATGLTSFNTIPADTCVSDHFSDIKGKVVRFDPYRMQYRVRMEDDTVQFFDPPSLLQNIDVEMRQDYSSARILSYDREQSGVYLLSYPSGIMCCRHLRDFIIPLGTVVRLEGLRNRGKYGIVRGWVERTSRYKVQLSSTNIVSVEMTNVRL